MELGVNILQLPDFIVEAALYNKKEIQSATYETLSTWVKQQTNRHEAYKTLHPALIKYRFTLLACELKQWVERTVEQSGISDESKFSF